jgi:hypothetical protein
MRHTMEGGIAILLLLVIVVVGGGIAAFLYFGGGAAAVAGDETGLGKRRRARKTGPDLSEGSTQAADEAHSAGPNS